MQFSEAAQICMGNLVRHFKIFRHFFQNRTFFSKALKQSDQIAHANLCGFGKSVIQAVLEGKAEELVLVNCCDSMRRVYDIVAVRHWYSPDCNRHRLKSLSEVLPFPKHF